MSLSTALPLSQYGDIALKERFLPNLLREDSAVLLREYEAWWEQVRLRGPIRGCRSRRHSADGKFRSVREALVRQPVLSDRLVLRDFVLPFILVTSLFFWWGVPANLNDVLIRQFMKSFQINRFEAGLVQSAYYLGYFLFSIPAALVMNKLGYKVGLTTGLLLYATGTLLFWPAAMVASTGSFFLLCL